MPSSALVAAAVGVRPLQENFQFRGGRPPEVLISPLSQCALAQELNVISGFTSSTYSASNRAMGFQFCLAEPILVQKVWWMNGTTATTNNADVAVYNEAGTSLLVSGGSTLIANANVIQEINCTDTLLPAPARYWCVYNQNGTTATPIMFTFANNALSRITGIAEFAGAVSLGATFTPSATVDSLFPFFGIAGRVKAA